jgi:hypothetical protein
MMAPTVAPAMPSKSPNSLEAQVGSEGTDSHNGGVNKEGDRPFCKACKNYGHQQRSSRLCSKNKKSRYYEGKTVEISTESYLDTKIITYVIPFGEPADQYSPVVNFLGIGNHVGLDTDSETGVAECTPSCAGSNLTLKEKIMSLTKWNWWRRTKTVRL